MSPEDNKLRELFIKWGSQIEPGEDLFWKSFEKQSHHERSIVSFIDNNARDINEYGKTNLGSKVCMSPIYNRIIHIFHKMEFVVKYMSGEFQIQCKDRYLREQFANIWVEFIRGWYFGTIYVGYGEDFKRIDDKKLRYKGLEPDLEGVPGRFRLYTRNEKGEFYSILSKLSGIKFTEKQKKRLVKCECGGISNWIYWWYLWIEWMEGMDRFVDSAKWLSKQAILTPKNQMETENINQQGENTSPFIVRKSSNPADSESSGSPLGKTKFDEIEVMNNETPMKIFEAVNRYFEINAAHLGFAGKVMEQKKERINAGENFPYQKVVSNIRTYLINSLNLCFDHMRTKFTDKVIPQDVKIVPSNQSFAQGLPEQQFGGTFNEPWEAGGFREKQFLYRRQNYQDRITGND